jgi:hypothetical protein
VPAIFVASSAVKFLMPWSVFRWILTYLKDPSYKLLAFSSYYLNLLLLTTDRFGKLVRMPTKSVGITK